MVSPGVCSKADVMLVEPRLSINDGLITSMETVNSSSFCSNRPAEITTIPSCSAFMPMAISILVTFPDVITTVMVSDFILTNEQTTLCSPTGIVNEYFPSISVDAPLVLSDSITTLAPIRVSSVSESVTIPASIPVSCPTQM